MTAAGPVLWVTQPSAGSVTRIDLTGISGVTRSLGDEPHDVELSPGGDLLYVADEDGRALIVADPNTLEELSRVELPRKPHDLSVDTLGTVWFTLIGDDRLGRFRSGTVELLPTGASPHDLHAAADGLVWFSNWNSAELSVYDPVSGSVEEASWLLGLLALRRCSASATAIRTWIRVSGVTEIEEIPHSTKNGGTSFG